MNSHLTTEYLFFPDGPLRHDNPALADFGPPTSRCRIGYYHTPTPSRRRTSRRAVLSVRSFLPHSTSPLLSCPFPTSRPAPTHDNSLSPSAPPNSTSKYARFDCGEHGPVEPQMKIIHLHGFSAQGRIEYRTSIHHTALDSARTLARVVRPVLVRAGACLAEAARSRGLPRDPTAIYGGGRGPGAVCELVRRGDKGAPRAGAARAWDPHWTGALVSYLMSASFSLPTVCSSSS
jgi:hypothetical protein